MLRFETYRKGLQAIGASALNLVFPPSCACCSVEIEATDSIGPRLCVRCIREVFSPSQPSCTHCGAYGTSINQNEGTCAGCRTAKFRFDRVLSLGEYDGALRNAVVQMKYEAGKPLATAVGGIMAGQLDHADPGDPPDLATCVPKFWLKRLATGVNSAEILMSALAKQAQIPTAPDMLFCRRNINKQSMLSPDQRRKNVRGAWGLAAGYDLADTHILLVDDVLTTGATVSEAARILKTAGASRVTAIVVGRASGQGR